MNIGFISTRLAGVDGVSLETAKIAHVLGELGHSCFYAAGELDNDAPPGKLVPAMHFQDPVAKQLHDEAFRNPNPSPELFRQIYARADELRYEIEQFIEEFNIDILVPQNASTIPMNISLGLAISDAAKRTRVKTLCHHHDFYWERGRFLNNGIGDILLEAFPPRGQNIAHLVINTIMERRVREWLGIQATYIPNVFDFETPSPEPDEYALSFRKELQIHEDDLIVLQPTRIIRRKGIEKAIELVRKLNDDRLILLITGYDGDEAGEYGKWLREEAEQAGIGYQFIGEYVGALRGEQNGHKVYTLWDIYPQAHFITYPSLYEGFGNALIETVYFRKPFIVHTYPVYLSDIKPSGIRAIEFSHDLTPQVLNDVRDMIDDPDLRQTVTEHNYEVGLEYFSYKVLRQTMQTTLSQIGIS